MSPCMKFNTGWICYSTGIKPNDMKSLSDMVPPKCNVTLTNTLVIHTIKNLDVASVSIVSLRRLKSEG